jgi:hypothetical protein
MSATREQIQQWAFDYVAGKARELMIRHVS